MSKVKEMAMSWGPDNWEEYYDLWQDMVDYEDLCPLTGIPLDQEFSLIGQKKCECGMDKVYGSDNELHSEWCPLYQK